MIHLSSNPPILSNKDLEEQLASTQAAFKKLKITSENNLTQLAAEIEKNRNECEQVKKNLSEKNAVWVQKEHEFLKSLEEVNTKFQKEIQEKEDILEKNKELQNIIYNSIEYKINKYYKKIIGFCSDIIMKIHSFVLTIFHKIRNIVYSENRNRFMEKQ